MRVLLINPTVTVREPIDDPFWGPPLGLAYLATAVSEDGNQAGIIDCLGAFPIPFEESGGSFRYGLSDEDILRRVREFRPDLVGITCPYIMNTGDTLNTAELIKQKYSEDVPVVIGGAHSSICPMELLQSPFVDFLVVGEGDGTLRDLCRALSSGQTPAVNGLLSLGPRGEITGNPSRERILDLDSIGFPRRDLLPMDEYFKIDRARQAITDMRLPKTSMLTSRGCLGNCVFCAIRSTWGTRWVPRSPENIVGEIESLVSEYGIREINFLDDSISSSRKRLEKLCRLIISRGIDIKWVPSSGVIIRTLDEDILRLMKKSGCYRLSFGLESGDPETLAFTRKKYDYDHARRIIKFANRIGIWTTATFIVGFPYETREQMERTIRFAIDSGVNLAIFYCAVPFPGTDLLTIYEKEGIEIPNSTNLVDGGVRSLHLSAAEIVAVRREADARFTRSLALRPWKPLMKIRSLEDLGYLWKIGRHGFRLLRNRGPAAGGPT